MAESEFKQRVFGRIRDRLPGCEIIRADTSHQQGMPDNFILWGPCWASLEFKASRTSSRRPNQKHYIQKLDDMSFAAFVYPENEDEVLDALEQAFRASRGTCVSQS